MSYWSRFGLGGVGGLLPLLVSLVALDVASFAILINSGGLTIGICVGYAIRVLGLFALGGFLAALNNEVSSPLSLVQIGIAAPALITSYATGTIAIGKVQTNQHVELFISSAFAETISSGLNGRLAGGFIDDLITGLQPGLGQTGIKSKVPPPVAPDLNVPYVIINPATNFCMTIPPDQIQTQQQYGAMISNFKGLEIHPGTCQ